MLQLPLATEFPLEDRLVAVFFRASDLTTANAQLSTDSIEVPNTDMKPKLFLQCRLHLTARHLGSRAAGRNQPLKYDFSQFGWMPVSVSPGKGGTQLID